MALIKKAKDYVLYISYGSLTDFLNCRRYYYWKRIRRLEKKVLKIPFITGRVIHYGMGLLLSGDKKTNPFDAMRKYFKKEKGEARKEFPEMSPDDEKTLSFQEHSTIGMLKAYQYRYSKFLKETKQIENERPLVFDLDHRTKIVGKIDNILQSKKSKELMHEFKSTKSLNTDYVRRIKVDPQTSLYFFINNKVHDKKLDGIIYDVIQKPTIRQTQKETLQEFLSRLQNWYAENADAKFHMERMSKPAIAGESVLNTIEKVSDEMHRVKGKDEYWQDFTHCVHEWGICEYYDLCHGEGETKENLIQFQKRGPSHKVVMEDSNGN